MSEQQQPDPPTEQEYVEGQWLSTTVLAEGYSLRASNAGPSGSQS
jgi:hypothetical protein